MRSITIGALLALLCALVSSPRAAEPADELPLLGFEESEMEKLAKLLKLVRKDVKPKEGPAHAAWEIGGGTGSIIGQWKVFKGKASQGDYALGIAQAVP